MEKTAGPLMNLGKKLQVIVRNAPADHVPVHGVFSYLLEHSTHAPPDSPQPSLLPDPELKDIAWCNDSLMRGLREGENRQGFIELLKVAISAILESSAHLLEQKTPDEYFKTLDSAIIRTDLKSFDKREQIDDDDLCSPNARWLQALRPSCIHHRCVA